METTNMFKCIKHNQPASLLCAGEKCPFRFSCALCEKGHKEYHKGSLPSAYQIPSLLSGKAVDDLFNPLTLNLEGLNKKFESWHKKFCDGLLSIAELLKKVMDEKLRNEAREFHLFDICTKAKQCEHNALKATFEAKQSLLISFANELSKLANAIDDPKYKSCKELLNEIDIVYEYCEEALKK